MTFYEQTLWIWTIIIPYEYAPVCYPLKQRLSFTCIKCCSCSISCSNMCSAKNFGQVPQTFRCVLELLSDQSFNIIKSKNKRLSTGSWRFLFIFKITLLRNLAMKKWGKVEDLPYALYTYLMLMRVPQCPTLSIIKSSFLYYCNEHLILPLSSSTIFLYSLENK